MRFHSISPRLWLLLEFLLYAALTAFALHATWLTWPDAFIDFSRELYLPWRVSCGDVLYRDLAYYFGPLSVYLNAALFALLGHPSIHALLAFNFLLWLATLLALRALLRRIASPLPAILAVSAFILLFSFNRYTAIGNDNFLAPYSHELPRGFLLALLFLLTLDSAFHRRSRPLFCLSGALLALSLFTKPEIALATGASSTVLFLSRFHWGRRRPARDWGQGALPASLLSFALGVIGALAAVLIPLSIILGSFSQALHDALLKLYLDCFDPTLTSLPYFKKEVSGFAEPLRNSLRLLEGAVLAAAPCCLARLSLPRLRARPLRLSATAILSLAAAAIGWFSFFPLNAALPLAPLVFGLVSFRERVSHSSLPAPRSCGNRPLALSFAAFSLALVSKIVLNCSIGHYGFVLALPAFCCANLVGFASGPSSRVSRHVSFVAASLLLGFVWSSLDFQSSTFRRWDVTHPVHDAAFLADPLNANAFNSALDWLRANTPPGSTLAVLPEGAILNVLSGRPNPTPYVSLPLTDWLRHDEADILAAYSNSPPDTLVLAQTASPRFGIDYATGLMAFLDPRYEPAVTFAGLSPDGRPLPYLLVATRIANHVP